MKKIIPFFIITIVLVICASQQEIVTDFYKNIKSTDSLENIYKEKLNRKIISLEVEYLNKEMLVAENKILENYLKIQDEILSILYLQGIETFIEEYYSTCGEYGSGSRLGNKISGMWGGNTNDKECKELTDKCFNSKGINKALRSIEQSYNKDILVLREKLHEKLIELDLLDINIVSNVVKLEGKDLVNKDEEINNIEIEVANEVANEVASEGVGLLAKGAVVWAAGPKAKAVALGASIIAEFTYSVFTSSQIQSVTRDKLIKKSDKIIQNIIETFRNEALTEMKTYHKDIVNAVNKNLEIYN